ncbi:ABC transporter permease [Streptomyces sp. NPDC000594]|uniref:ABC transporter permease n=1 Tax=Streptomyces sp. NPDC000594 TaxID=3154261 RepID=UPI00331B4C6A
MRAWYHSWLAALRIARRDALRAKGRSLLVLAMIALPVIGVSAADITYRSSQLSPEEKLSRSIGAADARISDALSKGEPVLQDAQNMNSTLAKEYADDDYPDGPTDVLAALPPGVRTLTETQGSAKITTKHGLQPSVVRELKASDPMVEGMLTLVDGRFPKSADETAVTTAFLKNSGLRIGSTLRARQLDRTYTVVGTYERPDSLDSDEINVLPGALLDPLQKALKKAGLPTSSPGTSYLAQRDGGFTWNTVKEINTKGLTVTSRAVVLDPPDPSEVPLYAKSGFVFQSQEPALDEESRTILITVVLLALLEICLLAGPAFAVGARRSRRQLGLVGANGGDRRHIRAIVLSGGLIIGAAAAVVGTVLGIALTFAVQPLLEEYVGERFGSFELPPLELLAIGVLAVATGVASALLPAINASRQPVLASLTGRRGVRRTSRVLPLIGLVAVLAGGAAALFGSMVLQELWVVALGSAVAELGVVAMTPALVGLFGRIGRFLPLSPRLALRDAVRNRGRTAPAVAAVLAAIAGTVAVATYAAGSDAEERAQYQADLPMHSVSVWLTEENAARDMKSVRDAVSSTLPVKVRADVSRIAVGNPNCSLHGSYGEDSAQCGRHQLIVPPSHVCPLEAEEKGEAGPRTFSDKERRELRNKDWRCAEDRPVFSPADVVIGGPELLKVLEIDDPAAEKALKAGKSLVLKRAVLDGDTVGVRLVTDVEASYQAEEENRTPPGRVVKLPAHALPDSVEGYGISVIMSPEAAEAAKIGTAPYGAYYALERAPRAEEEQRLNLELDRNATNHVLMVEKGFVSDNDVMMLALAIFAGLVTIGAAGIATGLSQADAEADLKTLAAVGATPGVRRKLSGFQCGVVAAMGVVLGTVAGFVPAIGLRLSQRHKETSLWETQYEKGFATLAEKPFVPIEVPWSTLALLLIAVPLGATLLAMLVTRSRGALGRRAAT